MTTLSVAVITRFRRCPRRYLVEQVRPDLTPQITSSDAILGLTIHRFIAMLYRKAVRFPLYYSSIDVARSQWCRTWNKSVTGSMHLAEQTRLKQVGVESLTHYWEASIKKDPPVFVEKTISAELVGSAKGNPDAPRILGRLDQVRAVSPDWLATHTPELLNDGQLDDKHDSVVILDLKTGPTTLTRNALIADPTLREQLSCTLLDGGRLQGMAYVYLYKQATGRLPVRMVWWHLPTDHHESLYIGETALQEFVDLAWWVYSSITQKRFPIDPSVGNCSDCLVRDLCRKGQFPADIENQIAARVLLSGPTNRQMATDYQML